MTASEYLVFIPLLLFGLALADLLSQWRRFFSRQYWYLPYILTTVMLTEIAIWNVYLYLGILGDLTEIKYFRYWGFLLQPFVFLLAVHALTPDSDLDDTEGYFNDRIPIIFTLIAAFLASHFIPGLEGTTQLNPSRLGGIIFCLAIAATRKVWLVYLLALIWSGSLFGKVGL